MNCRATPPSPAPAASDFYQALLDRQPGLVCCFAVDGRPLFLNAAARRYFFNTERDLSAWDFFACVPASARPFARRQWQQLSAEQPQVICEHPAIAANGECRWYRWHYTACCAPDGQLQQYQLFGEDIDAYRQNNACLLETSRTFRDTVFASLPVGLAIADERGELLETNAAFDDLQDELGRCASLGDLFARWSPRTSDGDRLPASDFAPLRALREQRATSNTEVCCGAAATAIWLSITAAPLPLAGYGVAIVCANITPRKRANQALSQNQAAIQALIDAIPDLMLRVRRDGTVLDCRIPPNFRTALPPAEVLIGSRPRDLWPPTAAEIAQQCIQRALATRQVQVCEYEVPVGERTARYEARAIACGPDEVLKIVRDISERKAAEEALRDSEQRFRAIFEQAAVGMVLLTDGGHFFRTNQRFCSLVGRQPIELLTQTDEHLTVPEDREADRQQKTRLLSGEIPSYALEKRYRHCDGSPVWVHVSVSLVRQPAQGSHYLLAAIQDISHRKLAEQQLQRQASRERLVTAIAQRIHESLRLKDILSTAVAEVRQFLNCDRVLIGRQTERDGPAIAAEASQYLTSGTASNGSSPDRPWPIEATIAICHLQDGPAELPASCQQFLAQFPARTHLVVPILLGGDWKRPNDGGTPSPLLWGWLAAQDCQAARQWQSDEIDFLQRVATQLSIAIQQSQLYKQLEEANCELHHLATIDSLTKIANRRCFDDRLPCEWQRAQRQQQPLALILCDIDDFKRYNDTYGHPQGDRCLQQVAAILQSAARRATDLVARYGGEEFVLVLPNTDLDGAIRITQHIQGLLIEAAIPHSSSRASDRLTLSLGLASQVPTAETAPAALLAQADRALYRAKAAGRDRFCY